METNSINSFLVLITGDIDNFMYTYILVALLVFTGIYFTIRTKGVQFRYIKDMFTQLFEKKVDKNGKAISSFQAMMVSTGSRVGTGNIAGIATALAMGGPGALFWMWVMALIGGASAFIVGVACEAKGRTSSSILAASSSAARSTRISISAASRSWSSLGEVVAGAALTGGSGVFFVASSMALSVTCSLFAKGLLAAS